MMIGIENLPDAMQAPAIPRSTSTDSPSGAPCSPNTRRLLQRKSPLNDSRRRRRGFMLVEVTLAVGVIAIAILAVLASITLAGRLSQSEREIALATEGIDKQLAELRNAPFNSLYQQFGPTGIQTFDVPGLSSPSGGPAGSIQLVVNETSNIPQLGLPRDLNGDGDALDTNVSSFYVLMPVTLNVQWTGPTGNQRVQLHTLLANR